MAKAMLGVLGLVLVMGACSCSRTRTLQVPGSGGDSAEGHAGGGAGGASGQAAGQGGGAPLGGMVGGASELRVRIEAPRVDVCSGECVELTAHAENGRAPYRYAWSSAIGEGAGPHQVCPDETTTYSVTASDTGTDLGELDRPSQDATASLQLTVDADPRCEPEVDAGVAEPPTTSVACSVRAAYEQPAIFYVDNSWRGYASLVVDGEGSVYLVGMLDGTIDLGGQIISTMGAHAVALKYDASCELVWAQLLGDEGELYLTSIAVSGDGELAVGGRYNGELYPAAAILKLSASDGSMLWRTTFGGGLSGAAIWDIAIDGAGDITMSGSAGGDTTFGGEPIGESLNAISYVAKLSSSGGHRYSFGVEDDDPLAPIAVHSSGSLAVAGRAAQDGLRIGDEHYAVGDESQPSYLSIHTSGAVPQWVGFLGAGDDGEWTGAMAIDREGNVVLERVIVRLDDINGEARVFAELLKMGPDASVRWKHRSLRGPIVDAFEPGGLAVDSQGAIIEVYRLQRSAIHVQKHTPDGEPLWSYRLGEGDQVTAVWGVATAPDDAVWLAHGEGTGLVITKLRP